MNLLALITQQGHINDTQSVEIAQLILQKKQTELEVIHEKTGLSYDYIADVLCKKTQLPILHLDRVLPEKLPPTMVDTNFLKSMDTIALARRNDRLVVGMSNPLDKQLIKKIQDRLRLELDIVVVRHHDLLEYFKRTEDQKSGASSSAEIKILEKDQEAKLNAHLAKSAIKIEYDIGKSNISNTLKRNESDIDDTPVVRFLQKVLQQAVKAGASDLHFEPFEQHYRIRFRIDGILHEVSAPPIDIKEKLATRIKVLARLDIAEKRLPQDGRIKLMADGTPWNAPNAGLSTISNMSMALPSNTLDLRISTLPTLFGEKIVMRVLENNKERLNIDELGYEEEQKKTILDAIKRPHGMVLVTGPTGSGKTISLYTFLSILNDGMKNISSAEDPAEIQISGINQVNINEKAGLNFASALRAFLRQDPDIIMVGEIRDVDTADIAVKAAQTGHLVFSTLHTNDAPSTLVRLMNMGMMPFNVAASVHLIIAQRLVRKLCKHCKSPVDYDASVLKDAGFTDAQLSGFSGWKAYAPSGCESCNYTGYRGRIGVYQVLPITHTMQALILKHATTHDIARQAQLEGVKNLRESGLLKVQQGVTSLEEVLSATN